MSYGYVFPTYLQSMISNENTKANFRSIKQWLSKKTLAKWYASTKYIGFRKGKIRKNTTYLGFTVSNVHKLGSNYSGVDQHDSWCIKRNLTDRHFHDLKITHK